MKKQIFLGVGIMFSIFLCSNVFASDLEIQNLHVDGVEMIFETSVPCQTTLSYESEDGEKSVELNDTVYRQSHNMQLYNLEFFTEFDYTLVVNNNKGVEETKTGTITVTPEGEGIYQKISDEEVLNEEITLEEMTRDQLLAYIVELLLNQ